MIYLISSIIYILGLALYKLLLLLAWLVYLVTRSLTSVLQFHRSSVSQDCRAEWQLLFIEKRVTATSPRDPEEEGIPSCTCQDPGYCHIWCIAKHRYTKAENGIRS